MHLFESSRLVCPKALHSALLYLPIKISCPLFLLTFSYCFFIFCCFLSESPPLFLSLLPFYIPPFHACQPALYHQPIESLASISSSIFSPICSKMCYFVKSQKDTLSSFLVMHFKRFSLFLLSTLCGSSRHDSQRRTSF